MNETRRWFCVAVISALILGVACDSGSSRSLAGKAPTDSEAVFASPADFVEKLAAEDLRCADLKQRAEVLGSHQAASCWIGPQKVTIFVFASVVAQDGWVSENVYGGCSDTGECDQVTWLIGDAWAVRSGPATGALPKIRAIMGGTTAHT